MKGWNWITGSDSIKNSVSLFYFIYFFFYKTINVLVSVYVVMYFKYNKLFVKYYILLLFTFHTEKKAHAKTTDFK